MESDGDMEILFREIGFNLHTLPRGFLCAGFRNKNDEFVSADAVCVFASECPADPVTSIGSSTGIYGMYLFAVDSGLGSRGADAASVLGNGACIEAPPWSGTISYRPSLMKAPSTTVFLADTRDINNVGLYIFSPTGSLVDRDGVATVHNNRANVSFFDGHVAARSYTELRTVTNRFTHVLQATLTPWN